MISFALMVKNEEKHIERCLKSVSRMHCEIVVLDTGCTDKTIDIAAKYTDKIYHQKWQDNFALHRNKSFSHCTGDWIFQIDADEELIFDNKLHPTDFTVWMHKLPEDVHAIAIRINDFRQSVNAYVAEFDAARIFRKGKVKYRRRIHNDPVHHGKITLCPPHVWLKHYGYDLTADQQKLKAERTIGLLLKSIEEDPEDYESYFYLAQAYGSWGGDAKKALYYAIEYEKHKDELDYRFNPSIYYYCAFQYFVNQDYRNCKEWIDRGLEFSRKTLDLDLSYMLMLLGQKTKNPDFIARGATAFVLAYENLEHVRRQQIGRFFFNNKPASYATALYYLTLYHLGNGATGLKKIKNLLPLCSKEIRMELEKRIQADLEYLGLEEKNERRIITPADAQYRDTMLQASRIT